MSERRTFEQIDLTGRTAMWRMVDDRNREICSAAPLVYYNVVRPSSARETSQADQAETAASSAMGSAVEAPVVETSVDVAARDGEGDGKVNSPLSEPPPTPSGSTDHAFDEATFVQKMAEHQVIDDEVMNGIQEVLVRLGFDKDQLPIFAEQDTLVSYEAKIESWMGQFNEDQKTDAQAVASALMSGALKKSDLNEKYLLQLAKKRRLEKEGQEEAQMKKDLASFDLHQFLLRSSKEQNTFYGQITQILTEMRSAVQEPLQVDQKVMQELASLIQDVGKVSDAQNASQHHALSSIASMTKQLTNMSWEMSAGSIDRRCIPASNRNGPFLKESMRETLLCIRMALMEVLDGTRANHEVLQQSFQLLQRQCDGTSKMVEILERMDSREVAREKIDVELKRRKTEALEAQEKAQNAEAQKAKDKAAREQMLKDQQEKEEAEVRRLADVKARKMKELEEAQLEAENARKKARILEEQMSSSGLTPEPVTPPMGGIGGHMNPQMGWAPMNPAMGMAPMMPPVMSQTGAPHMMPPPMGPPQMMTPMGPQMPPTQVPPTLTKARPPYPEGHMGP